MTIHGPALAIRASVITTIAAVVVLLIAATPASASGGTSAQPLAQGLGMGDQPSVRVRELQRALERRGFDVGAPGVDGRFGSLTASAVRRLQAARGLVVDGIVGRRTRAALGLVPRSARNGASRASRPKANAPAEPMPDTAPAAPAPPAASSVHGGKTKTAPLAMTVVFWFILAAIAILGIAWVWRYFRRRATRGTPTRTRPAEPVVPAPSAAPRAAERVIGYVTTTYRSTVDGHDRSSAAIAAACRESGRDLVEIICDSRDGRPLERPGLMHALERIANGEADGLVVADLRAFSRAPSELATLVAWFRDADATLIALDLGFDTATAEGRQVAAALIALGTAEEEQRSRQEANGHVDVRTNGRPAVRDQPELLNRIAFMRSAGLTLREIADQLNAEHVPTLRGGAQWRPSSIQAALGYRRPGPRDRMPQAKAKGG